MWRCHLILYLTCLAFTQSMDPLCSSAPEFKHDRTQSVSVMLGHSVVLTCKASISLNSTNSDCKDHLEWMKGGTPLTNLTIYPQNIKDWHPDDGHIIRISELTLTLRDQADFGVYFCMVRNSTAQFNLKEYKSPSHTGAVVASVVLLLVLALAAVVYSKCRLNFKLWYRNIYGEYELNDGKMYDAYISYVNNENDRKFVNFILKPHLENKYSHKLLLNDTNILPGAEPSAELLMNVSRCRRMIVVLSQSYLEQEWCTTNFRQGLWHLIELSRKPIFIIFQSQQKQMSQDISHQLKQHQPQITTLTWGAHSIIPSSGFWKELALAMPLKVTFHRESAGDPQTLLQGDKDPMLTQQPDYLDCRPDPDPAGDLGLRLPIYKTLPSKAPVLPAGPSVTAEPKPPEIDVSDLGSRSYAARTDFYCLVTEDDI
ncbi:single Ig IL-1-related receptor-like isoform X1 [Sinocyclocheilus anshuiensis]|uniref:Single Ig IL-1-related receptor-like n=2 Tax=Sinocyclocheilus anshuiensis TaxID=1608454 RepID=A0A671N178_9TELE|nr:PREDICTED: single Ig IL-1-related receptor-like isoform X1 [Sinocyclocheilus anshuiensis]